VAVGNEPAAGSQTTVSAGVRPPVKIARMGAPEARSRTRYEAMTLRESLAPRHGPSAARVGGILTLIAAGITAVFAIMDPPTGGVVGMISALTVPMLLVLMTVLLRRALTSLPGYAWVILPVVGIIAVAVLDLMTHDASAAGQVFLCYPVLYGASQLRPLGGWITAGVAVGADAVVVGFLLPASVAILDFCYVTATLVAMAVLLIRGGEVNDRLISRLQALAALDPLTGLVTRRVLDDAAQAAIAGAAQGGGTALILLDIDHFKNINDSHGHPVGDAVLVHLAALLVANSRSDSVTSRLGGDEMAVLLPGCPAEVATRRATHFLEAIRSTPLELADGTLIALSVSIGVAHLPTHAASMADLYQAADTALYDAKHRGRGTISVAQFSHVVMAA
jgi:diguanylate cyclase (GGDEF)-like protein